jgi:hypothetical protein
MPFGTKLAGFLQEGQICNRRVAQNVAEGEGVIPLILCKFRHFTILLVDSGSFRRGLLQDEDLKLPGFWQLLQPTLNSSQPVFDRLDDIGLLPNIAHGCLISENSACDPWALEWNLV